MPAVVSYGIRLVSRAICISSVLTSSRSVSRSACSAELFVFCSYSEYLAASEKYRRTLDVVERVLDEVDKSRDVDWTILGERLRSAILDSGEHIDAGFTEAQKAAIVAVCRETYYATSVVARAYAFKAVEALLNRIGE